MLIRPLNHAYELQVCGDASATAASEAAVSTKLLGTVGIEKKIFFLKKKGCNVFFGCESRCR